MITLQSGIPLQIGTFADHCPSAWQVDDESPISSCPWSQENVTLLPIPKLFPVLWPFLGGATSRSQHEVAAGKNDHAKIL